MVIQQECQLNGSHDVKLVAAVDLKPQEDNNYVINVAFNPRKRYNPSKSKGTSGKLCTHCDKKGHMVDTCYQKCGFPPRFKFKNLRAAVAYCIQPEPNSSHTQEG